MVERWVNCANVGVVGIQIPPDLFEAIRQIGNGDSPKFVRLWLEGVKVLLCR